MTKHTDDAQARWYALTTRPQHERKAAQALDIKGFQTFLPLYRALRQWSDRRKTLDLPLFPGYVFCRFTPEQRLRVLTSPNITSVVGVGRRPSPIPEVEVRAIQAMVASGLPVEPWKYLEIGQRVRIEGGALDGLTGIVVQEKNSFRVVVNVELLRRSVAVEISRERVAPDQDPWRHPVAEPAAAL